MWADTLQAFERQHLLQLITWAGSSVLIGCVLLLVISLRKVRAPLLYHFGVQSAIWGIAELAWGAYAYSDVPLRDYEGASILARELWIAMGIEAGAVLVGITLAAGGWIYIKRLAFVGAGVGIIAQASALLVLDFVLVRAIQL